MKDSFSNQTLPQEVQIDASDALKAANTAGVWMAWAGLGLAILWWAGATALVFTLISPAQFESAPASLITTVAIAIILPGFLIIMAGFMARQNKRANEANVLVLRAADLLLSPARSASSEIASIGEVTRYNMVSINKATHDALATLRDLSEAFAQERALAEDTFSKERMRAESVSYVVADNTRELSERLAEERKALETLSQVLAEQVELIGDTLPRKAAAVIEATTTANEEIAVSEAALETKLQAIKQAGTALATRLMELDAVAQDAMTRTDALERAVERIEGRLAKSQKTVAMAENASSMAVEAATSTGHALRDAVSAALDAARDANREIAETTEKVQTDASIAIKQLRAVRANMQSSTPVPSSDAHPVTETSVPLTKDIILHANKEKEAPIAEASPRAQTSEIDPIAETMPLATNDDVFEAGLDTEAEDAFLYGEQVTHKEDPESADPEPNLDMPPPNTMELGDETTPVLLADAANPSSPLRPRKRFSQSETGPDKRSQEWRDIIADMGNSDIDVGASPSMPREQTAEALIQQLQSSGIPLPTAFRARDKKKIAAAADKDHRAQCTVIRNIAGTEVERVAIRLRKNQDLMRLAQSFLSFEAEEAKKALGNRVSEGRYVPAWLSAYLLIDTALKTSLH